MSRDWWLVAAVTAIAIVETPLRTDLPWPLLSLALVVGIAFLLPWRRTHPLTTVVIAFGSTLLLEVVTTANDITSDGLYTAVFILVLPYSLVRWGSGRQVVIGLLVSLPMAWWVSLIQGTVVLGDAIGGTVVLMLPAAIGGSIRYRETSRVREREQVILREREQLARELHDTVAHHVSAIAIQAQAGQAVAAADPAAAVNALNAIEKAASQTLGEMRTLVGALRSGDTAELAPQPGIADIATLAHNDGGTLSVDVRLTGGLDDLPPLVDSAVYRLAQESITNARRHARYATTVIVEVAGNGDSVRLTVSDDGDPTHHDGGSIEGYGLAGMAERTRLLGGTFEAGPRPGRGWMISAVLPKSGPRA